MLSPADSSHVRVKIIKRIGDQWVFTAFFVCACVIRSTYGDLIDNPDSCSQRLVTFMNMYFYGYCVYIGFLIATLLGCYYPRLDTFFRIIQVFIFVVYYFGLFLYANFVAYSLEDRCKEGNSELRLFCLVYIISWYVYLGIRLLMLVMYTVKKSWTGRQHELEGIALFVDAE